MNNYINTFSCLYIYRTKILLVRSTSVGSYNIIFPEANRVDPDQTALTRAAWSGSALILRQVNTLSSRLNIDYSCTSKQIEKTTTKIFFKMLMILDFKILSLWFVIKNWWYNTLTHQNNWFLNVLGKSNFATPTAFGSVSYFVMGGLPV